MRYSAFISYNHRDRHWARWLHRGLESYTIPRRLRGLVTVLGVIGAKLPPVFRDRDELAASNDLAASVRAALVDAATLIVICSPNGAKSKWVNQEIREFAALGRADRIRCLIVDGDPLATDPVLNCFPPALMEIGEAQPLAADARAGEDGPSAARLKLIAGILDVPYDELRQRESQRRQRRLAIIATAALVGLVFTTTLSIFAWFSRIEAVRQRDVARQRTLVAERTVDFVKQLFRVSDPSQARGERLTAREVVDRGAEQLRTGEGLLSEPSVRADLGVTLAEVYASLGLFDRSVALARWTSTIPQSDRAVNFRRSLLLADTLRREGRAEDAVRMARRALLIAQALPPGEEQVRGLLVLGESQIDAADGPGARQSLSAALVAAAPMVGTENTDAAVALEDLARLESGEGNSQRARRMLVRALLIRKRYEGAASPSVSDDLGALATIAQQLGDYPAAVAMFQQQLAIDTRVLGASHPDIALTLNNLARAFLEQDRAAAAVPLLRRALAIDPSGSGLSRTNQAIFRSNLGLALWSLGKPSEADAVLTPGLKLAEATRSTMRGPIATTLVALRCARGETVEGVRLADTARRYLAEDYPDQPWRTAWLDAMLADCHRTVAASAAAILRKRWKPGSLFRDELDKRTPRQRPVV